MAHPSYPDYLEFLKLVQMVGGLGYFIIDLVGEEWEVSEVLADMLEFEKPKHQGLKTWLQFIHPDEQAATVALFEEAVKGQKQFKTTYRAQKQHSHEYIWLEVDAEVSFLADGKPQLMVGTAKNISSYKSLIEDLSKTTQVLEEAEKLGGLGTFKIDFQKRIFQISPILAQQLGTEEHILYGLSSWLNFTHPSRSEEIFTKLEEMLASKVDVFDFNPYPAFNPSNGKRLWLEISGEISYDQKGRPQLLFGTSKNITTLTNKQLELERKNKVLRKLAWKYAHGFRAPVSRALGLLIEIEEGNPTPEELSTYLAAMRHSLDETDDFIKKLVFDINDLES